MDTLQSKVTLRSISDADREQVIAIVTSPEVNKSYMIPDLTPEQAEGMFFRLKAMSQDENRFIRGIYLEDTLVGFLNDTDVTDAHWELGWAMHPQYHNRGIATCAVKLAIEALFQRGVPAVLAGAFDWNIPSMRVMEKCGMKKIPMTESIDYRGKTHTCLFYRIEP